MLDYPLALEIANGFGFVLSLTLAITLLVFLLAQIKEHNWRVITLTSGMILVKIGLAIGLGYRWLVSRCFNKGYGCDEFDESSWVLFISVTIIATGGMIILRVLSKPAWRPWSWLATLAVSLMVPGFYYTFDILFPTERPPAQPVVGFYHLDLVALSVLIAIVGSYAALEIARRALSVTTARWLWLMAAAVVMGASIWSMHFTAMMAFELPGVIVTYDVGLTVLSLIIPMVLTLIGFLAAASDRRTTVSIVLSGILIGVGVVAMHYTGMAAMEMAGAVAVYNLYWVMVSVIIAVVAAIVAVYLVFVETTFLERVIGAVVMGTCGISGLHYTAMVAFTCYKLAGVR